MKITINKYITLNDAKLAQQILEDYTKSEKSESLGNEELQRAGALYLDENDISVVKIYWPTRIATAALGCCPRRKTSRHNTPLISTSNYSPEGPKLAPTSVSTSRTFGSPTEATETTSETEPNGMYLQR